MYEVLSSDQRLKKHLPYTVFYSEKEFWELLTTNHTVILKPIQGTSGKGIIKVSMEEKGYFIQTKRDIYRISKKINVVQQLHENMIKRNYIIQQYIHRRKVSGHPFDLRLIVQRELGNPWEVPARFGQLTTGNSFLSNVSAGGKVIPIDEQVKKVISELELSELNAIAIMVAEKLQKSNPQQTLWGIDLAISSNGSIYIIEITNNPSLKKLKYKKLDPNMLSDVIRTKKINEKRV